MALLARRHVGGLVVGLLVGAAVAGAAVADGRTPAGKTAPLRPASAYADLAGDAQGGPDVTAVSLTGKASSRILEVTVSAPGWLTTTERGLEADREAWVWLDTDRNRATGDPQDGTDYAFAAWNDPSGLWWTVERWNGRLWESIPRSSTMAFVCRRDVLTWTVSTGDLGAVGNFRFYVVAGVWSWADDDWTAVDRAPDGGWWEYEFPPGAAGTPTSTSAPTLVVSPPETDPARPIAGRRLTVTFPVGFREETTVVWSDPLTGETTTFVAPTWTPVPRGTMVCDPSVAGTAIRHSESLAAGRARLSFVLPGTSKGRSLTVRVTITATATTGRTLSAVRSVTFRVR